MSAEEAVDEAIDRCVDEGFLVEFLKDKKEVSKMILGNNITMEEYGQVQRENGRLEGLEAGREEGLAVFITDYLEEGFSKEKILSKLMKKFNLTEEDACDFFNQVTQAL